MSGKGDRPSWRDLDRRRDRSRHTGDWDESHRGGEMNEQKSLVTKVSERAAKKALEDLFSGKGRRKSKAHREFVERLRAVERTAEFPAVAATYIATFGPPIDNEVIDLFIDARQDEWVMNGLDALLAQLPRATLSRRSLLRSKLNLIKLASLNPEIRKKTVVALKALDADPTTTKPSD